MEILATSKNFVETYNNQKLANRALTKYGRWFPLHETEELAGIVADLLTDGHLEMRNLNGRKKYDYLAFFSEDENELEGFKGRIKNSFGIEGTIRKWGKRINGSSRGCIISNAALVRVMKLLDVPHGAKVSKEYEIPSWVEKGSQNIMSSFLRRSFTCEGSVVYDINAKRWEIKYIMCKEERLAKNAEKYFEKMKLMLGRFGIETTKVHIVRRYFNERKKTRMLEMRIRIMPNSFLKFAEHINFATASKRKRLEKAVEWVGTAVDARRAQLKPVA